MIPVPTMPPRLLVALRVIPLAANVAARLVELRVQRAAFRARQVAVREVAPFLFADAPLLADQPVGFGSRQLARAQTLGNALDSGTADPGNSGAPVPVTPPRLTRYACRVRPL